MKLCHLRPGRLFIRLLTFLRKYFVPITVSLVIIVFGFLLSHGTNLMTKLQVKPVDLLGFLGSPVEKLDNTLGITNFLLLGIRGEGIDSPNLADTIIVVSYNHEEKNATIISIPRDLWVPSIQAKINSAYYYGEEASKGAGIKLAQASILEDLGLPIHYTAVVNFSIFKETIDLLGGIDIDINPGFTDPKFPISGMEDAQPESSRYEAITFATGSAHLNGETALKFVRSRHSTGDEGTDFARSRRQQQVITAMTQKMLSPNFLLDKNKIDAFFNILNRHLITNIDQSLYPSLAKTAYNAKSTDLNSITLSDKPDVNGLTILYNPPSYNYKGEWVLIPKDNNWNALKSYLSNLLRSEN